MRISLRDPVFQWWPGPPLRIVCLAKLAVVFMMEACAARRPGRVFPLLLTLTLLLLLKTASAGSFAPSTDSSITGETYFTQPGSTDTEGTADVTRKLTSSTEELSSTNYRHVSTAGGFESQTGFRKREARTGTDQNSFTDTESWTSHSSPEVSTELLSIGTELSTTTVSEWEDPSTVANITDAYTGLDRTEWQPATETRTGRDLTVTNLKEKDITKKDIITDAYTGFDRTERHPATETSETRTGRDLTVTNLKEKDIPKKDIITDAYTGFDRTERHPVTETSETRTGRDLTVTNLKEKDITKKDIVTDAYTGFDRTERHPVTETSETRTGRDLTVTNLKEKDITKKDIVTDAYTGFDRTERLPATETSETRTGRDLTVTNLKEKDITKKDIVTDAYTGFDRTERHPATKTSETRAGRDLAVTNLKEKYITEKDVTDTYISTTISRAGERTLLSILSNSTSSYTEGSSSSEVAPLTVTSEEWRTETTVVKNSTESVLSTEADQPRATFKNDLTTNASQQETISSESDMPHDSQGTQSHTGQPNVTGSSFEATFDGSSSNSTLPVTVFSSFESSFKSETETAANPSTRETSYTDSSASESSITPAMSPENSRTNTSNQDSETMTTETSTRPVNTEGSKKPESPQTHMDETTIPGLTTAPPTLTTMDDSLSKFLSGQRPFVPQTNHPEETTEVLTTAAGPATHRPQHTEEDTREASTASSTIASTVFPTTLAGTSTSTATPPTTHQLQPSTTAKTHTPHMALSTIETTQMLTTPTTEQHPLTTKMPTTHQSPSSSQPGGIYTDVSTLHLETSTATPGNTTAHGRHTTASYSKTAPTRSTAVVSTGKSTDRGSTQEADTTMQIPVKSTPTPGLFCANGGLSVPTSDGGYKCACLPAWTGATCTEDVNECVSSPCPADSECVNTSGSFSCKCPLGYDLEDGRSCTQAKTFLGKFSVNSSLHLTSTSAISHDLHKEILQLLNASLSVLHGYRRSILRNGKELDVSNMFSMSANVTSSEVYRNIQAFLRNCSKPNSRCTLKLHYQLNYHVDSLCRSQKNRCDSQSSVCRDDNGTLYCQCKEGFFKKNLEDTTCRDCGDGFERVNGTCVGCTFGFGGFNCNNFYGLIAKVVSPAAGGLLLIVIIALIVTCCRKDKNDINKIIFKSGDLQMSPYAEFPKSSRVSMEWGRETIEMQENGSTKNLLQMTDIYYSPALRNADLERNGLYPFSGLPGSRHSCIYPAQWNPSFISDDSRRRDYF